MTSTAMPQTWHDLYFTSQDGLRLHARHYPAPAAARALKRRPLLCLPGLTRNARDFHTLASFLTEAQNPSAREVFAVDYRGRGQSEFDPDWQNYTLAREMNDVFDFMTTFGIHDAAVLGTSRGGIIAMLMATMRPTTVGAVVLNDIGPVIEREGLLRIVAYVGRVPLPATWEEAGALVRDLSGKMFPAVPAHEWEAIARQWYNDLYGRPTHGYDQNLTKAIGVPSGELPDLWPQFAALSRVPLLVIRGELSDILSAATVAEMRLRHPNLEALTVHGEGHAPLLRDPATCHAIARFLARADTAVDRNPGLGAAVA